MALLQRAKTTASTLGSHLFAVRLSNPLARDLVKASYAPSSIDLTQHLHDNPRHCQLWRHTNMTHAVRKTTRKKTQSSEDRAERGAHVALAIPLHQQYPETGGLIRRETPKDLEYR